MTRKSGPPPPPGPPPDGLGIPEPGSRPTRNPGIRGQFDELRYRVRQLEAENERLRRAIEKALQAPEDELRGVPWADLTAALSEAGNTNTSPEPAE